MGENEYKLLLENCEAKYCKKLHIEQLDIPDVIKLYHFILKLNVLEYSFRTKKEKFIKVKNYLGVWTKNIS